MAKAVFGKTGQRHSITVRVTDVPLVLSSFPARIDFGVKVSWSAPPSAWRLWLLCLQGEKTSWETRAPVLGLLSQGSRGTGRHASAPEADSESLAGTHRPPDSLKKKKTQAAAITAQLLANQSLLFLQQQQKTPVNRDVKKTPDC